MLVSGNLSNHSHLACGVPQDSILRPDHFSDYITPVDTLSHSYGISVHADDTHLNNTFRPCVNESAGRANLEAYIKKLCSWMTVNKLKLNDSKTELIFIGTASSLKKINTN